MRKSVAERIQENSELVPESGCKLWIKGTNDGYGTLRVNGKTQKAHRVAWQLAFGEIPDGLLVCHTCDTPSCVNVNHLFLGTHQDNATDKVKKNRQRALKGEKQWMAKLSDELVLEIFNAEGTLKEIGEKYGISFSMVGHIKHKRNWKHLL